MHTYVAAQFLLHKGYKLFYFYTLYKSTNFSYFRNLCLVNYIILKLYVLSLCPSQVEKETRNIYCMYRHPKEGGVPRVERLLTANPEAEREHIETVVNFMCSFLWASIVDASPPQPQLNLL